VKTAICNDCDSVVYHYSGTCLKCNRKNLSYYDSNSPELQERISRRKPPRESMVSAGYIALITVVVCVVNYAWKMYCQYTDEHIKQTVAHLAIPDKL
jgi:hypothetical protein